jgi:hypothetical protein
VAAGIKKLADAFVFYLIDIWRKRMVDKKLLEILVCPVTKGPLIFVKESQELISLSARLAYPIRDDIPVMLEDEARTLTQEEVEQYRG